MLNIYNNIENLETFSIKMYKDLYNEDVTYSQLELNYDVLILDKGKYTVDDIQEYIDFYKYRPANLNKKLSIINNFDLIDIKSQNKLLKLFEENEENHVIISNNLNKILATIKSRAIVYKDETNIKDFENYPKRYRQILNLIENEADDNMINFYLKFYDLLIGNSYKQAYIKLTTSLDYNEQTIYEIIQFSHKKLGMLSEILDLQQKLFSRTNKKLQIENYLLKRI